MFHFPAAGSLSGVGKPFPNVVGDDGFSLDLLPLTIDADAEEQPKDEQRKGIATVDEIQPSFGNCFPRGNDGKTGEFFEVAVQIASAMSFTAGIGPVDFQARLRNAVALKVGEQLPLNLSEKKRSHSGSLAKVVHDDTIAG
jgi:hypothetical protein